MVFYSDHSTIVDSKDYVITSLVVVHDFFYTFVAFLIVFSDHI